MVFSSHIKITSCCHSAGDTIVNIGWVIGVGSGTWKHVYMNIIQMTVYSPLGYSSAIEHTVQRQLTTQWPSQRENHRSTYRGWHNTRRTGKPLYNHVWNQENQAKFRLCPAKAQKFSRWLVATKSIDDNFTHFSIDIQYTFMFDSLIKRH